MGIKKRVKNFLGNIGAAPARAKQAVRGYVADTKRGHLLFKQGYKPSSRTQSAAKMARLGKSKLKKR